MALFGASLFQNSLSCCFLFVCCVAFLTVSLLIYYDFYLYAFMRFLVWKPICLGVYICFLCFFFAFFPFVCFVLFLFFILFYYYYLYACFFFHESMEIRKEGDVRQLTGVGERKTIFRILSEKIF